MKTPTPSVQELTRTLGIELPILQAPMAGANDWEMAAAVSAAGGLGALPCAMLDEDSIRNEVRHIREHTSRPINLNFFCHRPPVSAPKREAAWREKLEPYYAEFGIPLGTISPAPNRRPFGDGQGNLVLDLKPEVVSFHFGLPEERWVSRLHAAGIKVLSSATTVDEARWLETRGCDAVIAQGIEAGGHRGMFLSDDISTQMGTMALVPQIADAVKVPVIASGGIGDGRGIAAAFALGACAVQLGTLYLFCPEAKISPVHRKALDQGAPTALTNLFSGKPARGIVNRLMRELGPMSEWPPAFPQAGAALAPLKAKTEPQGSGDFMSLWAGQAARLGRARPAGELTRELAAEAARIQKRLGP